MLFLLYMEKSLLKGVNKKVKVFHTTVFNNSLLQTMDAVFRENIEIYSPERLFIDSSTEQPTGDEKFDTKIDSHLRETIRILKDQD